MHVEDAALLVGDDEVRQPGLVQSALCRLQDPDVGVQHEAEVGAGGTGRSTGCARGAPAAARYSRNVVSSASSGVAPGRAMSTFTISPHTSTVAFGNRLYCESRNI